MRPLILAAFVSICALGFWPQKYEPLDFVCQKDAKQCAEDRAWCLDGSCDWVKR